MLDELDRQTRAHGLSGALQLTTCGCMGLCDEGPIIVVYPEGVWYRRIQASDVSEIVERHLGHAEPVERLVWRDASAMKAMAVDHGEKFRAAMEAREKAATLPEHLNQLIRGFMPSRCLLTALELDLFTVVGDGASAEQAGARINASARATAMLLNALVGLGLLSKAGIFTRTRPNRPDSLCRHRKTTIATGFCTMPISGIAGARSLKRFAEVEAYQSTARVRRNGRKTSSPACSTTPRIAPHTW